MTIAIPRGLYLRPGRTPEEVARGLLRGVMRAVGIGLGGRGIGLGLGRTAGAAAFVGAYDAIPNIVAAYGMRRLRTAYTGSLLRLRRSSDDAEQDIGYDSSGHLNTAAVTAFIGAGSGYIRSWYDQSGNSYTAAQTTSAYQPLYMASGHNGRPVGRWDGVNDHLATAPFTLNQPEHVFLVLKLVTTTLNDYFFDGVANDKMGAYQNPAGGDFKLYAGAAGPSKTGLGTSAYKIVTSLFNGASSEIRINGGSASVGNVGSNNAGGLVLGCAGMIGYFGNIDIAEFIICNAALSDANRQAAEAAANAYWAIY